MAQTIVSGYYKFGAATILRGFNGATAVIEYEEDSDGGVRLERMLQAGLIDRPGLWIDTYNGIVNGHTAGTIKARINTNCMYFVSVECDAGRDLQDAEGTVQEEHPHQLHKGGGRSEQRR